MPVSYHQVPNATFRGKPESLGVVHAQQASLSGIFRAIHLQNEGCHRQAGASLPCALYGKQTKDVGALIIKPARAPQFPIGLKSNALPHVPLLYFWHC